MRRLARSQGFLDPLLVYSRLARFAQPSEVKAPTELLRAALVLHARGLMNSQAIQHNPDWVWPFWVERQFDPKDDAFIPRAFNITHINLTHRNWTAVGFPSFPELPIVDPRGLVTPFLDGWSIDAWIIPEQQPPLIPAKLSDVEQKLEIDRSFTILTDSQTNGMKLENRVEVFSDSSIPVCHIRFTASSRSKAWLVISLRPYNPEGVSFIHTIHLLAGHSGWKINGKESVHFDVSPERHVFSNYLLGDVYRLLPDHSSRTEMECGVGMATAAALYPLKNDSDREVNLTIPLVPETNVRKRAKNNPGVKIIEWSSILKESCILQIPDRHFQFLFETAIRSIILHSPKDVYPGPFTYKRFWFRDAAYILNAMTTIGQSSRAEQVLNQFSSRLTSTGYFLSQEGEWDSNGEALWSLQRFCDLTNQPPKTEWRPMIQRAARWLQRKRVSEETDAPYAGLLPAGFSAEHLGPNDYYYWDDFWGVAGLRAAAKLMERAGDRHSAEDFRYSAERFLYFVERSLKMAGERIQSAAMPASPFRRLDAGSIGSLAVGYPLQLWKGNDRRLLETVRFLMEECFIDGGFYQEISHSGINPYLTLHVAQILLRAGDKKYFDLMKTIAQFASPTGQWPEAIHPRTKGGCMGDGQHIWASAEWILMVRNCFVREEEGNRLVFCSGIPGEWLAAEEPISFGPVLTSYGKIWLSLRANDKDVTVSWRANWYEAEPYIQISFPDWAPVTAKPAQTTVKIQLNRVVQR